MLLCASWSVLCSVTNVLTTGYLSHVKSCEACGCLVVHCLPGLQMTTTMGTVDTTTMTTSVATMVMSMATTSALVELQLLQQLLVADASFKQSITTATTTIMREVLLQRLLLQQVAMVHLLLQMPLQVQPVLPDHWLHD